MSDPRVTAAIIAGSVSLIGILVSTYLSRWQTKRKLELEMRELELLGARLESEVVSIRQSHLLEVTRARLAAYPRLWRTMHRYNHQWLEDMSARDREWAREYRKELNTVYEDIGVLFSDVLYRKYSTYIQLLDRYADTSFPGAQTPQQCLEQMDKLYHGTQDLTGVAGAMKNDLGSYVEVAIQESIN